MFVLLSPPPGASNVSRLVSFNKYFSPRVAFYLYSKCCSTVLTRVDEMKTFIKQNTNTCHEYKKARFNKEI